MRDALAVVGLMATFALGFALALPPAFAQGTDHLITICHDVEGNGNTGNGYNLITVSKDSIVNVEGVENGHALHDDGDNGGDSIPAFAAGSSEGHEWGSFAGQGTADPGNDCATGETTTTTTTAPPPPPPTTTETTATTEPPTTTETTTTETTTTAETTTTTEPPTTTTGSPPSPPLDGGPGTGTPTGAPPTKARPPGASAPPPALPNTGLALLIPVALGVGAIILGWRLRRR